MKLSCLWVRETCFTATDDTTTAGFYGQVVTGSIHSLCCANWLTIELHSCVCPPPPPPPPPPPIRCVAWNIDKGSLAIDIFVMPGIDFGARRHGWNCRHFADDIYSSGWKKLWFGFYNSVFFERSQNYSNLSVFLVVVCCKTGDWPLPEPMTYQLTDEYMPLVRITNITKP